MKPSHWCLKHDFKIYTVCIYRKSDRSGQACNLIQVFPLHRICAGNVCFATRLYRRGQVLTHWTGDSSVGQWFKSQWYFLLLFCIITFLTSQMWTFFPHKVQTPSLQTLHLATEFQESLLSFRSFFFFFFPPLPMYYFLFVALSFQVDFL